MRHILDILITIITNSISKPFQMITNSISKPFQMNVLKPNTENVPTEFFKKTLEIIETIKLKLSTKTHDSG